MTNWIFQSNPIHFGIDEYLQRQRIIMWSIRQKCFKDEISIGDTVYIWRSDGHKLKSGGIIAKGEIKSLPQKMKDDALDLWDEKLRSSVTFALRVKIYQKLL